MIAILKLINKVPINKPAKNPSTVLFGDIFSASFLEPNLLPISYAKISDIAIAIIDRLTKIYS